MGGEGDRRAGVDSDMVKGYPAAQNQTLQVNVLEGSVQGSGGDAPAEQARAASRRHRCCVGRAKRQRAVCGTRLLLHERVDPPTGRTRWLYILFCPNTSSPLTAEWAVLLRHYPSGGASGRECDGFLRTMRLAGYRRRKHTVGCHMESRQPLWARASSMGLIQGSTYGLGW